MKLPIVMWPSQILKNQSINVTSFDEMPSLLEHMVDTMVAKDGVGLAAPQVGFNIRVFVLNSSPRIALFNPEIIEMSPESEWVTEDEGCLSFPGQFAQVRRPDYIKIKAQDMEGKYVTFKGRQLFARCICHEIDHLNGRMFFHNIGPIKRDILLRKWTNANKLIERAVRAQRGKK